MLVLAGAVCTSAGARATITVCMPHSGSKCLTIGQVLAEDQHQQANQDLGGVGEGPASAVVGWSGGGWLSTAALGAGGLEAGDGQQGSAGGPQLHATLRARQGLDWSTSAGGEVGAAPGEVARVQRSTQAKQAEQPTWAAPGMK